MTIYSGLHDYLIEDSEFCEAARVHSVDLIDLRRNAEHEVASCDALDDLMPENPHCRTRLRCWEDARFGRALPVLSMISGLNTKFIATGQTGYWLKVMDVL